MKNPDVEADEGREFKIPKDVLRNLGKTKSSSTGEAVPPPNSPERREFLRRQAEMIRAQEAAAAERRRKAAAREAASSDAALEQAAKDQAQAQKDRQMQGAYERAKSQPFRRGGSVKKYAGGGSVSSASKRADGCATKGKTRGKFV